MHHIIGGDPVFVMAEIVAEAPPPPSTATTVIKTSNTALQGHLTRWVDVVDRSLASPNPSVARTDLIMEFCRSFVPVDVTEDDLVHFSGNLSQDDEYFMALQRELRQCESGIGVESITGNQRTKAIFTLHAPAGAVSDGSELDIVREVTFISHNNGVTWTAEG